jgi:Domain of unknown function (DUF397)
METADLTNWRKSTYSSNGGASCVEVANMDKIMVRDTTDRSGPTLSFSMASWKAFTAKVKASLAADSLPIL